MKVLSALWIAVFVSLLALPGLAQMPYYRNYDTVDGLPSSEVYDIHLSEDGRMWCATDRGLAVFDGYEFKTYTTEHGMANNAIFNLYEDAQEHLWMMGLDGSINVSSPGPSSSFQQLPFLQDVGIHFFDKPIEDEAGRLLFYFHFIGFTNHRFYRFNPVDRQIDTLSVAMLKKEYAVIEGGDLELLVIQDHAFPIAAGGDIQQAFFRWEDYWIGALGNTLYQVDARGHILAQVDLERRIEDFCLDRDHNLWVGTYNGLFYFEKTNLETPPQMYFPNHTITAVEQDFEGSFWVSTTDNGLFYIPNFRMKAKGYADDFALSGRVLSAVALSEYLFCGTSRQQIFAVDAQGQSQLVNNPRQYNSVNLGQAHRQGRKVYFRGYTIEEDAEGNFKMNRDKGRESLIAKELSDGTLLSINRGRIKISRANKPELPLYLNSTKQTHRIECVAEGKQGEVWLGSQKGLFLLTRKDSLSIKDASAGAPALQGRINAIACDARGNLWLATHGHGLLCKTPDSLYQWTTADGLHSNLINCLLIAPGDSTLWIGTNQGLNQLDYHWQGKTLHKKPVQKYGVLDGLPSNFINAIEWWKGHLWLATNEGLAFVAPQQLQRTYPKIPIYLEKFEVNQEQREILPDLVLGPAENDLFLRLTGVSYRKAEVDNFYRYRLFENQEPQQWIYTNDRNIRFLDLSPGQYTFEAAAQNKAQQWSDPSLRLSFQIRPPFQQSLLFKSLLGLLLLLLFGGLLAFRDRQLRQRNRLQKAQMQAKEYELSALRSQMNPHFVFNSLNAIQNFIFKNDRRSANHYLSVFARLMRDALHFSRIKYIALQRELHFIASYLDLEKMRFPAKFEFKIVIDENLPIRQYAIPTLLLQPILENVVKHAFKGIDYPGYLEIRIAEDQPGKSLTIEVEDNGKGLPDTASAPPASAKAHQSLGLSIVRNQLDLLNAGEKEALAALEIVDLKKENPDRRGLRVSLKVPIQFVSGRQEKK